MLRGASWTVEDCGVNWIMS